MVIQTDQLMIQKCQLQKQLSFLIGMILRIEKLTKGTIGLYLTCAMIRKIKPTKIDAGVAKKLRISNFIEHLDLSTQFDDKPATNQSQPQLKNNPINPNNQQITSNSSERSSKKDSPKHDKRKKEPIKPETDKNISMIQHQTKQKSLQQKAPAPPLQKALSTLGKALEYIKPKQLGKIGIKEGAIRENQQVELAIQQMKSLDLKDFSILIHKLLVNSSGIINTTQKYIWKEIQQDFLRRFQPTTDPVKIRSYSKVIYSLAKSKAHKDTSSTLVSTSVTTNLQSFETKFALLLPSASHQSFSTIITSLSRMGPLSQQFSYIAERLYYSKYNEFSARERVQINYALTRNGKNADSKLIQFIDSMNLKQILIMLRCYQNCGQLNKAILTTAQKNIIPRKKEMNVVDIGDICGIYFEAMCQDYRISPQLERILTEMYKMLARNMNEVAFQKIWKNLPTVVNRGFLQVEFIEEIIKTIRILKKKQEFPERIWKPMRENFKQFENLEIRVRLEEIK